ncbi:MAG: MaoC family dehydratase [Nocardioidaceae bacterium]|nr:MaoC family dehydratase [Nocardioidaceae bacterium]
MEIPAVARVFERPADVLAAVGEDVGPGSWVALTQQRVDAFAAATGDRQWIHVDPERAAAGPFGGTIAHGYLTLALIPMLAAEVVTFEGCAARINYGTEKVRFPQALRVGRRVRARGTVNDAREVAGPAPGSVQVILHWTVEIEDLATASGVTAKPACVADTLALLVPAG